MGHPLCKIRLQFPYRTEERKSEKSNASLRTQVYNQMSNDQIIKLHLEYDFIGLEYLRAREALQFVPPNFLQDQKEINESMRQTLVDWLVEVSSLQINYHQ